MLQHVEGHEHNGHFVPEPRLLALAVDAPLQHGERQRASGFAAEQAGRGHLALHRGVVGAGQQGGRSLDGVELCPIGEQHLQ